MFRRIAMDAIRQRRATRALISRNMARPRALLHLTLSFRANCLAAIA
jgi:hypothetical protein